MEMLSYQEKDNSVLLDRLHALLQDAAPAMFLKKEGMRLYALLWWFGFVIHKENRSRLDNLDQELVCKIVLAFEKFKMRVGRLAFLFNN